MLTLGLSPGLFGAEADEIFGRTRQLLILACGTSYHAGLVAKYWIESIAKLPVSVEIASEYRYRDSVPQDGTLVMTISQSGETADTLAALQHAKSLGMTDTLTVCNVPESALIRQSRLRFLTRAGPEIGVASTKAFTTQLAALFVLTLVLAKQRGRLDAARERELLAVATIALQRLERFEGARFAAAALIHEQGQGLLQLSQSVTVGRRGACDRS